MAESLENPEKDEAVDLVKTLLGGVEKWRNRG